MDMTIGDSAILSEGKCLFSYQGQPAILLFDIDERKKEILSSEFRVIPM